MAWSLSNSPDTMTFSSPPKQQLGYDMTVSENNSVDTRLGVFPSTTPFQHNDCTLSGYSQRCFFHPITSQSSSQLVSPETFNPFDNSLEEQSGFEYHEKPFTTGFESFCPDHHTSTFPANVPSTPNTNQDRVPRKESTSHRVTKKRCGAFQHTSNHYDCLFYVIILLTICVSTLCSSSHPPLECGWKGCERPRPFTDKGTLLRHIKNQHVDPHSFKCPSKGCVKTFSRKDNMEEHLFRVHRKWVKL